MKKRAQRIWLAAAALLASGVAQAFIADGRFEGMAEGYSLGFDVSFHLDDGTVVNGGHLYFGTDDQGPSSSGDHYMYFAMPKDFVDNTFGSTAVGWGTHGHTFKDLLNSDALGRANGGGGHHGGSGDGGSGDGGSSGGGHHGGSGDGGSSGGGHHGGSGDGGSGDSSGSGSGSGGGTATSGYFVLHPVSTTGQDLELTVDYIATDSATSPTVYRSGGIATIEGTEDNTSLVKNEGLVASDPAGVASQVKEIATSMEYNVANFVPQSDIVASTDKTPVGLLADSPGVLTDANGDPVTDANGDYQCDPAGPDFAACSSGWIYEIGYEMRFDASLFDSGWTDAQTVLSYVDLGDAHVSPHKTSGQFSSIDTTCDSDFNPEACGGGGGTTPVPEPASGALLALGLALLGLRRRRSG